MKIAFLTNDLSASQLAYEMIEGCNVATKANPELDVCVFYENLLRPCHGMGFMSTNLLDAWSYNGPMVATSLGNAQKLISLPCCTRRFFYVWDLEWIRIKNKSYGELSLIYQNPKLNLVARSLDHKKIIEECWNRDVKVIENFNVMEFLK